MIFWRPTDFHHFHDWVGLLITLLTVALIALAIWAFQRLFPSAPKPLLILPFTLGFVATCAFVIGLNYGKDEVETMSGVMTGYSHARRASSGSTQGHYGVIEVKGMKIDVPLSVIEKKASSSAIGRRCSYTMADFSIGDSSLEKALRQRVPRPTARRVRRQVALIQRPDDDAAVVVRLGERARLRYGTCALASR